LSPIAFGRLAHREEIRLSTLRVFFNTLLDLIEMVQTVSLDYERPDHRSRG